MPQADAAPSTSEGQQEGKSEGEKKTLAFGDVKDEDVKVYYGVLTNGAEVEADESGEVVPQFEERDAQVSSLSNDNWSMTISFVDPDAATNVTDYYVVEIDALQKYAPIMVEFSETQLTAESDVASDSESCDVTIRAENDTFAAGLSAGDIKLGGSFEDMSVTGAEASGDTLVVHLSGRPKKDYDIHATRGSKAAWASTRRSYTSILSQAHRIPLPMMTSDEEWRTVTEYGKTSETKVKDEQKYTFYWFDRA